MLLTAENNKGQSNLAKGDIACCWCIWGPFWGRGGRRGQRLYHSKERWRFPIGCPLHCDRCAISNHSAAICYCMSRALKSNQQGWVKILGKFEEEWVDLFKPNFNTIWERYGAVVCKRNRFDIFCRLNTMNERDRQTDHGTRTSIAIGEIACQQCRLIIIISNN